MAYTTDVIEEVELNSGNNDLKMDTYFEHLLTTLKGNPQNVWLENFSGVDTDILAKNMTILFYQAKTRYIEQLMEHNIDDVPELTLRGRKGNGAHKRLSLDIFELERFVKEGSNVFPKETLTYSARYVTFKKNYTQIIGGENEEGEVRKDNIAVLQEITDLKFILCEKDNKIIDIKSKLMAMEKRFSNM